MPVSNSRWCLYIDVEWFSVLYDQSHLALTGLRRLIEAVFRVGALYLKDSPNRIFAHQIADGMTVVSKFHSEPLDLPIAIGIAVLSHVAAGGMFAKASFGEGGFADIKGCYPKEVRDSMDEDGRVTMGSSVMTLFPVMGTAHISAVGTMKESPSGALFTVPKSCESRLPGSVREACVGHGYVISVDWVHANYPLIRDIQAASGLEHLTPQAAEDQFLSYVAAQHPPTVWVAETKRLCHLD